MYMNVCILVYCVYICNYDHMKRKGFYLFPFPPSHIIITHAYPVFGTNQIYQRASSWHCHCHPNNPLNLFGFLCRHNAIKCSILGICYFSFFCYVCHFAITTKVKFSPEIWKLSVCFSLK